MARATTQSSGEKATAEWINTLINDYLSQSDTELQTIARLDHVTFQPINPPLTAEARLFYDMTAKKLKLYNGTSWLVIPAFDPGGETATGTASGTNPIVKAHGLSGAPQIVVLGINAVQPYVASWNSDATNITFYHNAAGSLTISYLAIYQPP